MTLNYENERKLSVFGDPSCYGPHMSNFPGKAYGDLIEMAHNDFKVIMEKDQISFREKMDFVELIRDIYAEPITQEAYNLADEIKQGLLNRKGTHNDVDEFEKLIFAVMKF